MSLRWHAPGRGGVATTPTPTTETTLGALRDSEGKGRSCRAGWQGKASAGPLFKLRHHHNRSVSCSCCCACWFCLDDVIHPSLLINSPCHFLLQKGAKLAKLKPYIVYSWSAAHVCSSSYHILAPMCHVSFFMIIIIWR